jgi:hypothetical protein
MRRPAPLMLGAMQIIPVCMIAGVSDLDCAAARTRSRQVASGPASCPARSCALRARASAVASARSARASGLE